MLGDLGEGETVDSTFFCKQLLEKMEVRVAASHIRRGKILLLMDSVRPHREKISQQKLSDLETEWLSHSPYSPNVSPYNFRAF